MVLWRCGWSSCQQSGENQCAGGISCALLATARQNHRLPLETLGKKKRWCVRSGSHGWRILPWIELNSPLPGWNGWRSQKPSGGGSPGAGLHEDVPLRSGAENGADAGDFHIRKNRAVSLQVAGRDDVQQALAVVRREGRAGDVRREDDVRKSPQRVPARDFPPVTRTEMRAATPVSPAPPGRGSA
jgi:hypothetical protein